VTWGDELAVTRAEAVAVRRAREWLDMLDYDLSKETEDSELLDLVRTVAAVFVQEVDQ